MSTIENDPDKIYNGKKFKKIMKKNKTKYFINEPTSLENFCFDKGLIKLKYDNIRLKLFNIEDIYDNFYFDYSGIMIMLNNIFYNFNYYQIEPTDNSIIEVLNNKIYISNEFIITDKFTKKYNDILDNYSEWLKIIKKYKFIDIWEFLQFFRNIPEEFKDDNLYKKILENSSLNKIKIFEHFPLNFRSKEVCLTALKNCKYNIFSLIPNDVKDYDIYLEAVKNMYQLTLLHKINMIPSELIDYKMLIEISKNIIISMDYYYERSIGNINFIKNLPNEKITYEVCLNLIRNNRVFSPYIKEIIPESFIDDNLRYEFIQSNIYKPYRDFKETKYGKFLDLGIISNNKINEDIALILIELNPFNFEHLPKRIITKEFILKSARINGNVIESLHYGGQFPKRELTYEIYMEAIKNGFIRFGFLPKKLKKDYYIMLELIKKNGNNGPGNSKLHQFLDLYENDILRIAREIPEIDKEYQKNNIIIFLDKYFEETTNHNFFLKLFKQNYKDNNLLFKGLSYKNLQKIIKSFHILFDKNEYKEFYKDEKFEDTINKIYGELEDYSENLSIDLKRLFEIIIKIDKKNDDNNVYVADNFLNISFIFSIFYGNNISFISDHRIPIKEKNIVNNDKICFIKYGNAKKISNEKFELLLRRKKIILEDCKQKLKINSEKAKNIVKINKKKYDNKQFDIENYLYNYNTINNDVVDFDKKTIRKLHNWDFFKDEFNMVDLLLVYLDRYEKMFNNNFNFVSKIFFDNEVLKSNGYLPEFLIEILKYNENEKITIAELVKKLKNYINTNYDFKISITKKTVIDSLLEKDEWKNNFVLEKNTLFNYQITI
jgi:hypothetical protein